MWKDEEKDMRPYPDGAREDNAGLPEGQTPPERPMRLVYAGPGFFRGDRSPEPGGERPEPDPTREMPAFVPMDKIPPHPPVPKTQKGMDFFCPGCGKKLNWGDKFCPACGASVAQFWVEPMEGFGGDSEEENRNNEGEENRNTADEIGSSSGEFGSSVSDGSEFSGGDLGGGEFGNV